MSVVAWDGTSFVADRLGENAGMRLLTIKSALFHTKEFPGGVACGWTGTHESGLVLARWLKLGEDPKEWPSSVQEKDDYWSRLVCLGLDGNGYPHLFLYERQCIRQYETPTIKQAWGAGRDLAVGAMEMGASAVKAVQIAAIHSTSVGFGVDAYHVRNGRLEHEVIP